MSRTDLIQCVPNFSEGRDEPVIGELVRAVKGTPGVLLLDRHTDTDHNRTVLTYLGDPAAVTEASLRAARVAVQRIDLNRHAGVHPRMGAVDVIPFVPVDETPMDACIHAARETGARLAAELELPVYFYEEAAARPDRRNLALVRGAGFEAMRARPLTDDREPDLGPRSMHPTAGAVAVGARGPLLAFNVILRTADLQVARAIARRVRERDGGLLGVRALGFWLETPGCAQVSMNVTRPASVPLYRVFEMVKLEARRYGVTVSGSELIGAMRLEDLLELARYYLGLHEVQPAQVLDLWAARMRGAADGEE